MNFKKKYNKLFSCYSKRLAMLNAKALANLENPMDYFVTYLKFMRDYYILAEPLEVGGQENLKIAIIASVVSEYDQYKTCINKYFKINDKGIAEKIGDLPVEEVTAKYNKERAYH